MYSLTSAAVLAADLARHPYGARLADTVDRVLALTPVETGLLTDPAPEPVRARVLAVCQESPRVSTALSAIRSAFAEGVPDGDGSHFLRLRLEESLMGGLEDLHDLLRREAPLLGLADRAQQVALDAVTAAWAGASADLRDLEALGAPWQAALSPVPPPLPQTPYVGLLRALLDEVLHRHEGQWQRSVAAHQARHGLAWSQNMHEACAAAFEAGRLVDVARAQLAAARVLALTHTDASPYAVGMVVTAAVQALCTQDLLDPRPLLAAWEAGA